ncbi:MAG: hypothetical protein GY883_18900 [Shimia sp.]|nr:hypothetical protein [Shimia sp.]
MTHSPTKARLFVLGFVALTFVPGALSVARTKVTDLDRNLLSGAGQRMYEERFEDHFPLREAASQTWSALKFGVLGEMAEGALAGRDGVLFTTEEFSPPADTRDFASALQDVRRAVEAAGAELVPVIVPDKARMMADHLPRQRSANFQERYARLQELITSQGLRTLDLRPALMPAGSFMLTDTHWSPSGADRVADLVADSLSLEMEMQTTYQTKQIGEVPFEGDLIAFADTGPWRDRVGPVPETIATFDTTAEEQADLGLFDAVDVPVALVGTSFSKRDDFHFLGFLKSHLNADVVSYAQEGKGPFVPMDSFLHSSDLTTSPPQFVLWEIPERYLNTWSAPL